VSIHHIGWLLTRSSGEQPVDWSSAASSGKSNREPL